MTKDLMWSPFHRVQPGCSSRASRWLQDTEAWVGRMEEEEREQKEEREGEEEGEDEKRREGEGGREGISLQKHVSSDLLPPVRLHLLKFPKPLKTAPPSIQRMSLVETFHI